MKLPELPADLAHDLDHDELRALWRDLVVEIVDPDYLQRTHGNRRTYDAGCLGPLCRKAIREHGRRRTNKTYGASGKYVFIDQILEEWRPAAEMMVLEAYERVAEELTSF